MMIQKLAAYHPKNSKYTIARKQPTIPKTNKEVHTTISQEAPITN